MAVTPKMHLTGASSNSANELGVDFLTPLTYETAPGRLLTSNKMKISSFIRHVRSRWKGFGRRMQSPSAASNGTKVGEDETEVLAGSREVALCLPIDLGAAFRLRLRKRASRKVGRGASGWLETTWTYSRITGHLPYHYPHVR